MIVNRLQSMRRARRRLASVTFCARTFQKPARYFCYCPTGPSGRAGGGLPTGVCLLYMQHWNVCTVVFWRVVWYLRGRDRINVVPVVAVSWPSRCGRVSVRPWPWWALCGGVAWLLWPWLQAVALAVVAASLFCVAAVWLRHAEQLALFCGFYVVWSILICTLHRVRVR